MASYADIASSNPGAFPGAPDNFYFNSVPNAGWWKYLMDQGLGGVDPTSQFAQNAYNRYYSQYLQRSASNPNLGFYDDLLNNHPDLRGEYQAQSPEQRGDFTGRSLTPRARWVMGG